MMAPAERQINEKKELKSKKRKKHHRKGKTDNLCSIPIQNTAPIQVIGPRYGICRECGRSVFRLTRLRREW